MIPGPWIVIACPHCGARARYLTLVSGNTFGAEFWTDGKMLAPMLPQPPGIVGCHECARCFRRDDAEEVDSVPYALVSGLLARPPWNEIPAATEPTERQYLEIIAAGFARDVDEERLLRLHAWWRRNDAFRGSDRPGSDVIPADSDMAVNLRALQASLDEAGAVDLLMKGEMLRELGEFESARRTLDRVQAPELAEAVAQIRGLCEARDPSVRPLGRTAGPA